MDLISEIFSERRNLTGRVRFKIRGCEAGTRKTARQVLALDEANGKILWEHKYDAPYRIDFPAGKYEELGRAHLLDPIENARGRDVVWSAPPFADKSFFARNQRN